MEEIKLLVQSSLGALGAAQALAVAMGAGLIMKDYNQTLIAVFSALIADRLIALGRDAVKGHHVDAIVQSSWHSFMTLPMGQFLAASISFALIILLAFNVKSFLKKL
jgi:hypothetical protein